MGSYSTIYFLQLLAIKVNIVQNLLNYFYIEFNFHAFLSNDHQDHHLDPYDDIAANFDENVAVIMNRALLREIFLSIQIFKGR
jgi:hypothetical protein